MLNVCENPQKRKEFERKLTSHSTLLGEWILNQTLLGHSTHVFTWQSAAFNPAPRPIGSKEPILYETLLSLCTHFKHAISSS